MPSQPTAPVRTIRKHRLTATTHYDGAFDVSLPGELLTVTADPRPEWPGWDAWTLADVDAIPTLRRLAILTTGMPMPQGEWRYLCAVSTETYCWFVFEEVQS